MPGGLVSEEAVRDEDFFKNKGKISETKKGKCKKKKMKQEINESQAGTNSGGNKRGRCQSTEGDLPV